MQVAVIVLRLLLLLAGRANADVYVCREVGEACQNIQCPDGKIPLGTCNSDLECQCDLDTQHVNQNDGALRTLPIADENVVEDSEQTDKPTNTWEFDFEDFDDSLVQTFYR